MIRHIVMWKLKDFQTEKEKEAAFNEIKEALESLKGKIPELDDIRVFANSQLAPENNFDIILDSSFDGIQQLNDYQKHPEHLKAGAIVKKYAVERSCVDYEE